jgi:hypothetical protein
LRLHEALPGRVKVGSRLVEDENLVRLADHGLRYDQRLGNPGTRKAKRARLDGQRVAADGEDLDLGDGL